MNPQHDRVHVIDLGELSSTLEGVVAGLLRIILGLHGVVPFLGEGGFFDTGLTGGDGIGLLVGVVAGESLCGLLSQGFVRQQTVGTPYLYADVGGIALPCTLR
eukprot:NODE_15023_length_431_cov_47.071429_g14723_i0.p1 GENE.NODE_15023_length_431_cov_47.071429_g14723_i0~~NODE_15023_length_431_cov_47.071429_g14723_i0.p1  ORF type:complete len:103 (+),score=2.64 NODE_15023_length_431_cov_47.071429_g14723_i0:117-425(+)